MTEPRCVTPGCKGCRYCRAEAALVARVEEIRIGMVALGAAVRRALGC